MTGKNKMDSPHTETVLTEMVDRYRGSLQKLSTDYRRQGQMKTDNRTSVGLQRALSTMFMMMMLMTTMTE